MPVWHAPDDSASDEIVAWLDQGAGSQGVHLFRVLPLVALPDDHPSCGHPPAGVIETTDDSPGELSVARSIDVFLDELRGFTTTVGPNGNRWVLPGTPAPPFVGFDPATKSVNPYPSLTASVAAGAPGVLCISLQTRPGRPPAEHSAISVATRIAAEVLPVVVAVGNWRSLGPGDTRSALSKLPWLISVGALADTEGAALTATSSAGRPGGEGPAVSAYGANPFVDGVNETSFAAPRVAIQALFIRAFLLQLQCVFATLRSGSLTGVPLLVHATIDSGFRDYDPTPAAPLPMLPYSLGVSVPDCREAFARGADFVLPPTESSALVRALLLRAAQPLEFAPHEAGLGMITLGATREMLQALTLGDLARLRGQPVIDGMADATVAASAEDLQLLFDVVAASRLQYGLNFRTGVVNASVRPPFD